MSDAEYFQYLARQGYEAFEAGVPYSECPYLGDAAEAWCTGWAGGEALAALPEAQDDV